MVGPVALIVVIGVLVRLRQRAEAWPLAVLIGVKHALVAAVALSSLVVIVGVGVGATRALLHPVADAMIALLPDAQPPASQAGQRLEKPLATLPTVSPPDPVPTPTPRAVVAHATQPTPKRTPEAMAYEAPGVSLHATLPAADAPHALTPAAVPTAVPTATPASARVTCDPAYPDERTCIPPGPPFDQGCAVTDERLFAVLPPDPQGLDHDGDGIGCEPIT